MIPQVVGPVLPHAKGSRRFRMPKKCPLCGAEIVKPEGEAMHRCPNPKCESRGLETLINWVWDIDGVGEQAIRRLWREGIVTSLPDLYRLTKEQLMELDGYAEISAGNAVAAIEQSKQTMTFNRVLAGLNIPDTGWVTARNLAAHFGSIDELIDATQEEIQEAEGIGPGRAEGIAEWFSDEENLKLVQELRDLGLRFETGDELKPVEGPLSGQTYVITGTLESFTRDEAATGARGEGREGLELGLEEDRRADRRRGAGLEIEEGAGRRRSGPRRKSPAKTAIWLALSRTDPGPPAPSRPTSRARSG